MLLALVIGYLVGSAVWCGTQDGRQVCHQLNICIEDSAARQYVTNAELVALLRQKGLYPIGKSPSTISTQGIETAINQHSMVRTAECYTSPNGDVQVVLTQRVPVLRVLTAAESYLVDTDHLRMPVRESVRDTLLLAEGNIGERMATQELVSFAEWLRNNRYWRYRISKIRVRTPRYIELIQPGDATIIIGGLTDYEQQLDKLQTLQQEGLSRMPEHRVYREWDLRYAGQVIGR